MINSQILRIIEIRWNLVWVSIYTLRVDTPQLNVPKDYIVFLLLPVIPSNLGLNSELEQKRARKWRWQIYVAQIMQKYQHPPSAGRVADSKSGFQQKVGEKVEVWMRTGRFMRLQLSASQKRYLSHHTDCCWDHPWKLATHPHIIWATTHIFLGNKRSLFL